MSHYLTQLRVVAQVPCRHAFPQIALVMRGTFMGGEVAKHVIERDDTSLVSGHGSPNSV